MPGPAGTAAARRAPALARGARDPPAAVCQVRRGASIQGGMHPQGRSYGSRPVPRKLATARIISFRVRHWRSPVDRGAEYR
jgi:hypothetical protein